MGVVHCPTYHQHPDNILRLEGCPQGAFLLGKSNASSTVPTFWTFVFGYFPGISSNMSLIIWQGHAQLRFDAFSLLHAGS